MNETGIGVGEDRSVTSRSMLGSTLCFATMTALHGTGKLTDSPFVIIAQSSATLDPHILAGCDPCRGCPAEAALKHSSTLLSVEKLRKRRPASWPSPLPAGASAAWGLSAVGRRRPGSLREALPRRRRGAAAGRPAIPARPEAGLLAVPLQRTTRALNLARAERLGGVGARARRRVRRGPPGRTCFGEAGGPAAATIGTPTPGGNPVAGGQHGSPLITRGPGNRRILEGPQLPAASTDPAGQSGRGLAWASLLRSESG